MNAANKRKDNMDDDKNPKRVKKACSYGDKCYRRNPAHLREFSHPHLEAILNASNGGDYSIPPELNLQRQLIQEQLEIIVEKKLYVPASSTSNTRPKTPDAIPQPQTPKPANIDHKLPESSTSKDNPVSNTKDSGSRENVVAGSVKKDINKDARVNKTHTAVKAKDSDYRPIVPPTRRATEFLTVVRPAGNMAAKHAASAPYHIFYTTIAAAKDTHDQPYSVTFLELLDRSLGELRCSLQINFMVEPAWLLAQYYFAGYSEKKLTILYEEECADMKNISQKKPHVEAYKVPMATPFGKHHTKMMILCYEDGSLRVVVSTANLYMDDWENRTQGLWFSPRCPELPVTAMPHEGDSPTAFKKSLLRYLSQYRTPILSRYVARVQRCDFSHINVFLVASAPGGHFDMDWGLTRIGSLLRQHCAIPRSEQSRWPLIAQASSIGSYGKEPRLWLTGDFLQHFTKIKEQPQTLSQPPDLKLIYPSLENVKQSHDGLLGGGCLPYAAEAHFKQPWLNNFLYQWKAKSSNRDKGMPHIKSYTRTSPDNKMAAFYLLTSGNISKAAWGNINKGNAALRIMSYEAGVLFLPRFVLICMWCAMMAAAVRAQGDFYTPQTFKQHVGGALFQPMHQPWNTPREMDRLESYQKGLFTPALRNDVDPASQNWRPAPANERDWRGSPSPLAPQAPLQPILQSEPWRPPHQMTKEQQAAILHHKQALTSEGAFRFEYASDNGLAAGEQIEPDGSRVGAYQYKDPSGQIVKLKYRAGKDGFQILEGSHLPKSPEPVVPPTTDQHYQQAYQQQRLQYDLQQQYNQQRIEPQQNWDQQNKGAEGGQRAAAAQYNPQSWRAQGQEDDGQYRPQENEVQSGPHNFGEGFAFSFQG